MCCSRCPAGRGPRYLPPRRARPGCSARSPAWREIAGISDGLLAPADERRHGGRTTGHATLSLDEGLLGSWSGPFGWIVIAEPLRPAELRSLAAEVGRRQRLAEGAADRFPERAVEAERLRERHAEAERGASTGFWRIRVLAGGCDAASAARVAGLFCASAGLDGLPYALSPAALDDRDEDQAGMPGGDAIPASPFCGSTELLAALARPPDHEVPGIRLALRPDFDVTPEAPVPPESAEADAGIPLGEVLDRNMMPAGAFTLSRDSLNRHVFVCGATGAGKSQTVRSLLEAATRQNIPWLVIEPAKAEYRLMASRLSGPAGVPGAEVIRIRPGEPDAVAAGLNPLEPAADTSGNRFPLQTHADLVRALFIAAFRSEEPFPQVLSAALTRAYEEAGWDLALGEPCTGEPAYPTLTALQRAAERVVTEIGYSQRITDDVLGFIRVRLASLRLGTTGRFLEGGHPIDFGALLRKNVVLEIEDVGDDADKAFLMGTVLIRLAEHLRLAHRTGPAVTGLRHLTVVEEAHRLLRRPEPDGQSGAGAAGHAVEMFAGLLAEIRAYGEGLVIAEQIPARLVSDAIKNTAVKITHRLPAADDRDAVGATMNATQSQSRFLVTLAPGQAAVFRDGMDFPVLVKMKDGSEREMATPGTTLDARTVVTPRSATCGAGCAARPCTLRDMRAAQRALDDFPLGPAVGGARRARAPDRVADAGAHARRARQVQGAGAPGESVRHRARGRRGGSRTPGAAEPGRARPPRPGGDPRQDRPRPVAVPGGRTRVAAGRPCDGGDGVRRGTPVGHRERRAAGLAARRVHRLQLACAVPEPRHELVIHRVMHSGAHTVIHSRGFRFRYSRSGAAGPAA